MSLRTIENFGTVAVLLFGLMLANIALHARRFQRCGREALLVAAAFIIAQAAIRTMSINRYIEPETARSLVSLSAIACLAIIAQITLLRRKAKQLDCENDGG